MVDGHAQGQDGAHGMSDQVGLGDAELVHEVDEVGDEVGHGVAVGRFVGQSVAA